MFLKWIILLPQVLNYKKSIFFISYHNIQNFDNTPPILKPLMDKKNHPSFKIEKT